MNERIKELAMECGAWTQVYENIKGNNDRHFMVNGTFNVEKFANLIIKDCAEFIRKENYKVINGEKDYQNFSVTSSELLKHFGVKNEI